MATLNPILGSLLFKSPMATSHTKAILENSPACKAQKQQSNTRWMIVTNVSWQGQPNNIKPKPHTKNNFKQKKIKTKPGHKYKQTFIQYQKKKN